MPEAIATPRLASAAHSCVPAGSVAIGGSQTGIYPVASPGGWRMIGRTPLELFRADREPPALLDMGDRVRFVERAMIRVDRAGLSHHGAGPRPLRVRRTWAFRPRARRMRWRCARATGWWAITRAPRRSK